MYQEVMMEILHEDLDIAPEGYEPAGPYFVFHGPEGEDGYTPVNGMYECQGLVEAVETFARLCLPTRRGHWAGVIDAHMRIVLGWCVPLDDTEDAEFYGIERTLDLLTGLIPRNQLRFFKLVVKGELRELGWKP
jgi:hypothetical protein